MTGASRFRLSPARLELLESRLRAEGIERAPARTVVRRADPAEPVPLTFSQSRFWFLEQFAARRSAYVISAAMRVRGDFQLETFARACDEVVRRHESLRTVFGEIDGHPCQWVRPELRADVRVHELDDGTGEAWLDDDAILAEVARREAELVDRPFDLGAGPLFRVELLRFGPDEAAILLSMHHLVSDRWSMGVLMRELTEIYACLATGRAVTLPELAVQYPDFARWQRETMTPTSWDADLAYWTRQLRGAPVDVNLPTDRPRPREKSYRGSSVPVELPAVLVHPLRELARKQGATLFMVLTAVFSALVGRLGDQDDVVVGTPVANRTLVELEPLIGFFVNTLALRTDLSGDPTFTELLGRVHRVCLEAYEHQGLPFEKVVEELAPERSLARTPVFQVMLSYQNVPFPAWTDGPVRVEPVGLEASKAEFDLLLDLFEDGDRVWGRLEYSVDLFTEASARRLVTLWTRFIRAVAADPDVRVSDLPLVDIDEHRVLAGWGTGPVGDRPEPNGVAEAVGTWARQDPERTALRGLGVSTSYAELNTTANRLAHRLRRLGVGTGTLVGVALPRSADLVVAVLAVLKAGGACVPFELDQPRPWLAAAMADARVAVLLSRRDTVAELTAGPAEVLCIEDWADASRDEPTDDPRTAVDGADLAYVRYGTDAGGRPVGTRILHSGLMNGLLWTRDTYDLGPADRVLHHTPFSSGVAMWELLLPLLCGGTLVLARPGGHRDPAYLAETIRAEGVTTVHFGPSMLLGFARDRTARRCAALRHVYTGGEAVPAETRRLFHSHSRARLHHLYAPDAAAGPLAAWTCDRESGDGPVPVGFPAANTRLRVLDRRGRPVPVGVPGDLYAGGPALADGLDLVADPFEPAADRCLHRTGEMARFRADGAVEALGRREDYVALGGQPVDLASVEAALVEHERVREAAVVVRGGRIVAYVGGEALPGALDLAAQVKRCLPEYLVPAAFVAVPALPRTPHQSVDRAGLPDVSALESGAGTDFVAPRDGVEQELAQLWREVLGAERVGARDNFFELGGHSLLATKLVARIRAAYGVAMPIRTLFDHPTVAGLAGWLAEQPSADAAGHGGAGPDEADAIPVVVGRHDGVPLSFTQERLVRHHPVPVEDPYHNVLTAVVLSGRLDEPALRGALDDIMARHEALRTRIVNRSSTVVQVVDATAPWPFVTVDLRTQDEATTAKELRRIIEDETGRPFRIGAEPMVRATLVGTAEEESVLILVMHHLVTDNWSYGVLVHELRECYEARVLGRAPHLPKLAAQYPDYAAWQRSRFEAGGFEEQTGFWRERLAGLGPAPRFTAVEEPGLAPATGSTAAFTVDSDTTTRLTEIGRAAGATPFMVLLAAFELVLSAYAGGDDMAVAFPVAGRDRPETEHLIGYFVNHLIVRADLSGGVTFRGLLDQIRRQTLDAYAHQGVPLWTLDEVRRDGRDPFRILFNLLNATLPTQDLHGLRVAPLRVDLGSEYVFDEVVADLKPAEVDLALIMREHEGGLRGMWLYSLAHVDATAMAALVRGFTRALALVAADPDLDVTRMRHRIRTAAEPQERD
jgi:amino acid adenylation domain-containing protein